MFQTSDHSGFATGFNITFANGWTASVQWGDGNYCENRFKKGKWPSRDAEIAAWKGDTWHKFSRRKSDCVKGWCSPEEVTKFLRKIATKP